MNNYFSKKILMICLLITGMIVSSHALSEQPYHFIAQDGSDSRYTRPCINTPTGTKCLSNQIENSSWLTDSTGTEVILLGAAVVANEVRTSRLETISSIQGMHNEVTNLNKALIDNYKSHLAAMQKLMLEKINAIAKDPSWSQESYEALKNRLIKDLSDVFETKND